MLHDPQQQAYPPNRYQNAALWCSLLGALKRGLPAGCSMHPELESKLVDATRVNQANEEEDLLAGWYRSFEVADVVDESTTTTPAGPTGSVLLLPNDLVASRAYPFRVETGCMAASIGLVMWSGQLSTQLHCPLAPWTVPHTLSFLLLFA